MARDGYPYLVMKFGGTSLGSLQAQEDLVSIVRSSLDDKFCPVIVCSALSTSTKASGTTSLLLRASVEALQDGAESAHSTISDIRHLHLSLAGELGVRSAVEHEVIQECEDLAGFLSAVEVVDELSPRMKDTVVSKGERLSCILVRATLESRGIPASAVFLDNVFPKTHFSETEPGLLDRLSEGLGDVVRKVSKGHVCVATGFFGAVPGSLLARVGRGYSDLTAALLASSLQSPELIIWKQVDGVFTGDPRLCSKARLLSSITADEAAELTFYGSEVVHQSTMNQVIYKHGIPIRIVNSASRDRHGGTIIKENGPGTRMVTSKDGVVIINVKGDGRRDLLSRVFSILHSNNILPDIVTTSEVQVSAGISLPELPVQMPSSAPQESSSEICRKRNVSVETQWQEFVGAMRLSADWDWVIGDKVRIIDDSGKRLEGAWVTRNVARALAALTELGQVTLSTEQAILSIVGKNMRRTLGTAAAFFGVLAEEKVNVQMISQGGSEINITTVVGRKDQDRALMAVHDKVVIGSKPSRYEEPLVESKRPS